MSPKKTRPKPVPRTGKPNHPRPNNPDSPMVWGAEAIGAYINLAPSIVYRLHRERRLPTRNIGALLVAKKAELDDPATWPGQGGAP